MENMAMKLPAMFPAELDLMSFSLYVPDYAQAKLVRKQFLRDPEIVYKALLALVTGEHDLVEDILKRL